MAISGGFCMVVPSLTTFPGLIVFSVGIGLFGGSFVALIAVMLVDVLGPERLFSAFGICVLFQGVAHLTGPPFAGWLQDITGSWNLSFYMCGSMLLIGTIILLFEPVGRKYMDRKSETPVGRKCMDKKSETPIV
ncbi:unnamed protein product [Owenia fusiformis]|uniref:Major facilitator superfamily (MFS) profile domain-containing protein n=1 Tax=Owenia fusiformis TaxID=6347 RepID=A0A8S4NQ47_OWEFU|nr:unnamed protein product [Owenia fusiformis]